MVLCNPFTNISFTVKKLKYTSKLPSNNKLSYIQVQYKLQ